MASLRRACTRLGPRLLAAAASEAAVAAELALGGPLRAAIPPVACTQNSAAAGLRHFHSSHVCPSLAETLKSEADYEQQNYKTPEEVVAGPPKPWKLTETIRDTHLTLTREFPGEEVSVDLLVNNQPEQEPYENEAGELEVDVGVVFNVSVTKGDKSLVFECRSDGGYMVIQHVSLEPAEGEVPESFYTGPVYAELDEQLQTDFAEFLSERGVNEDLGAYLLQLMHDKEQREYTEWLHSVHAFVTK